jgi:peptidyl-prolyl cis-trans isomerase C
MQVKRYVVQLLVMIFILSACGIEQTTTPDVGTPQPTLKPTATVTSKPPTETPVPLALVINGFEITLEEFGKEVDRFMTAQAEDATADQKSAETIVLEDLIARTLLQQGAIENGFEASQEMISERFNALVEDAGGESLFNQWLESNRFDQESFLLELEKSIQAAWMRDLILASVPQEAEQVKLRQIFLLDASQAQQVLQQLDSGTDFATLAAEYDPVANGELGWVPRNYLLQPELEGPAFALQPGEYSQVIETSIGFHILQVTAIEENRRLSPEARLIWQELALQEWVNERRETSEIEISALE